jgi:hypothetical protein
MKRHTTRGLTEENRRARLRLLVQWPGGPSKDYREGITRLGEKLYILVFAHASKPSMMYYSPGYPLPQMETASTSVSRQPTHQRSSPESIYCTIRNKQLVFSK